MLFVLGLAIVAIGIIITLVSPNAGLLFYWAWFIVRPQELTNGQLGGYLPLERFLAIALIISLVVHYRLLNAKPFYSSRITWALVAFVIVDYLSIPFAVWRGGALLVANELGKTFIFYFCLINLITNSKELRRFLWVYVLGVGWLAGSSIWAYGAHPYYAQGIQRATSLEVTWGDPNGTASNLALTIPVLFALLGGTKRLLGRAIIVGLLGLYLVTIVLTGSRAGIVVTTLMFLATAVLSSKRLLLVPALLIFFVVGWAFMPAEYQQRYRTLLDVAQDVNNPNPTTSEAESAHGRIIGFEVAMQMFKDRPILGVGAGDFPAAWWAKNTPYSYHGYKGWHQPHNLPGQVLAELGLLGVFSFGYFLFAILRENRAVRRQLKMLENPPPLLVGMGNAIVVVVLGLFVGGLSSHNLYRYNWYLAGGLAVLLRRIADREEMGVQAPESAPSAANPRKCIEEFGFVGDGPPR